jgi:hypothetical protein
VAWSTFAIIPTSPPGAAGCGWQGSRARAAFGRERQLISIAPLTIISSPSSRLSNSDS